MPYGIFVVLIVTVADISGEDFRVLQLTPPGSACSVTLMRNADAASEIFHFGPAGQAPGHEPQRASYGSFLSFADPDGNGWLLQEVRPGAAAR